MVNSASGQADDEGINIANLMFRLWRRKLLGFAFLALFVAGAAIYLNGTTYLYTAELTVTPADQDVPKGATPLAGLGSLVGIDIGGQGGSFSLYTEALTSLPVAEALSRDPRVMRSVYEGLWSEERNRWEQPKSSLTPLINGVKRLLGIEIRRWQPPNSKDLQEYLQQQLIVGEDPKKGLVRVQYKHHDPMFAREFLQLVNKTADEFLRKKSLSRSMTYIRYLEGRLNDVQVAEYRQSLSQTLSAYEKTTMMASSDASFAAEPFGDVRVSNYPTTPNSRAVLLLSVALGLVIWVLFVLVGEPLYTILRRAPAAGSSEALS